MSGNGIDLGILDAALTAAGDVAFVWDIVTDRISFFGDTASLFGFRSLDAVASGEAFHERINPEDLTHRLQRLSEHFMTRRQFDCEYRVRSDSGEFRWVHERGRAEFSPRGEPLRLSGMLRIVERRKQDEAHLERLASYDALTGHYNAARLRETLEQSMAYAQRYGTQGGFVAVGIDQMAAINENYGHETADAVIIGIGQRMERCLRGTDHIGRLGGDRFGVVLSNCTEEGVSAAAEKIVEAVRSAPIETPTTLVPVTVSAGAVGFPGAANTAQDAIVQAESVMHDAKKRGRNCAHLFRLSPEQCERQHHNARLGERVVAALREDRIVFAYQPIVASATGEVTYYETLLRMIEPDGEVVAAGQFIPVAEKLGFMRLLDRRVLDLAIRDLTADPDVRLGLNISGLTATDRSWLRGLVGMVKGRPQIARRLTVEITETAALQDFEDCSRFVEAVRELGCRVALDDFGAGYTSFRHLKTLAVDVIKIDGSFIRNVAQSPENQLFIRTLVGFAEGFGLSTVAECVETEWDAAYLAGEGVHYLQGYYFGVPTLRRPWEENDPVAPAMAKGAD